MTELKELYDNEIAPALKEELGLDNAMEIPRITKITLNMGVDLTERLGERTSGAQICKARRLVVPTYRTRT